MTDYKSLLTSVYRNNDVWSFFVDCVNQVFNDEIVQAREKLLLIRSNSQTETVILQKGLKQLGFDPKSKFMTHDHIERLYMFINQYWPTHGTQSFVDFLGFVKNTRFTMDKLWTTDYETFITEQNIQFILEGNIVDGTGPYYPTSHVEMGYNIETYNLEGEEEVYDLFNRYAPINLVLLYLTGFIEAFTSLYLWAHHHDVITDKAICYPRDNEVLIGAYATDDVSSEAATAIYTKDTNNNQLSISNTVGFFRQQPFVFNRDSLAFTIDSSFRLVGTPKNEVRKWFDKTNPVGLVVYDGTNNLGLSMLPSSTIATTENGLIVNIDGTNYLMEYPKPLEVPEGILLTTDTDTLAAAVYTGDIPSGGLGINVETTMLNQLLLNDGTATVGETDGIMLNKVNDPFILKAVADFTPLSELLLPGLYVESDILEVLKKAVNLNIVVFNDALRGMLIEEPKVNWFKDSFNPQEHYLLLPAGTYISHATDLESDLALPVYIGDTLLDSTFTLNTPTVVFVEPTAETKIAQIELLPKSSYMNNPDIVENLVFNHDLDNGTSGFLGTGTITKIDDYLDCTITAGLFTTSNIRVIANNKYIISFWLKTTSTDFRFGITDINRNILRYEEPTVSSSDFVQYSMVIEDIPFNRLRLFIECPQFQFKKPAMFSLENSGNYNRLGDDISLDHNYLSASNFYLYMDYQTDNYGTLFEISNTVNSVEYKFRLMSDLSWYLFNNNVLDKQGSLQSVGNDPVIIKVNKKPEAFNITVIHNNITSQYTVGASLGLDINNNSIKKFKIGSTLDGQLYLNGFIKRWLYWPQNLGDF